jgi:hypothetical protein
MDVMIEFIKNNLSEILTISQFIIIPLITVFWTKKTICLSTADDVIKLREDKSKKREEKRKKHFAWNCYVKCYLKQRKYKGWCLHNFNEFGDVDRRGFQVKNKFGEVRGFYFPEGIVIRKYGYDPSDRNYNQPISYIPNSIKQFFINLKFKKDGKRMGDLHSCITED